MNVAGPQSLRGPEPTHGRRNRKKRSGWTGSIGMALEKEPVSSSVPVLFVFQTTGGVRLVALSQV